MTPMTPCPENTSQACLLTKLPPELQVNLLTYLRAFDLSSVQQTCLFFSSPILMDSIVRHASERVYPPELSHGFDQQPILYQRRHDLYSVEHLRNMELIVIARVLSRPEPNSGSGFIVSKSWCKAALKWLEVCEQQRQQVQQTAQLSKKNKLNRKQRVRNRRLSDISPPWPNCNSDILCEHSNLVCMSNKSSRARRRLIDRQSWKAIANLYPDSTPIESIMGECLICRSVSEAAKESTELKEQASLQQRKKPLDNPSIRQFYTRSRGVPTQAVKREIDALAPSKCPLQDGVYYLLPRVWCQGWRRYIKTGEVGGSSINLAAKLPATAAQHPLPPPPDATSLLCAAHRLPLFPAHLEAYLKGQTDSLFPNSTEHGAGVVDVASPTVARAVPVGQQEVIDQSVVHALQVAGLGPAELQRQLQAMRILEDERRRTTAANSSSAFYSPPEDWVEMLTSDEYVALLEEQRWSGRAPAADPAESISFVVRNGGASVRFLPTTPCRDCHPTAQRYCANAGNHLKRLSSGTKVQKKHRAGSKVTRSNASTMHLEY